ncbi:hypothetical protein [Xanthomonas cannabis]|uniref:hypothetical protein n=1 Tax=Xanthomonas cannabis TaxID=1885674 RepID=UPI00111280F6|nr:hypothetical protein [Xanthomonas cannabis]
MNIKSIEKMIKQAQASGVISIKEGVFLSTGKNVKQEMLSWDEGSLCAVHDEDLWIYTEKGMFMPLGNNPREELSVYA